MEFSPQSRVWIYQADKLLSTEEQLHIKNKLQNFVTAWTAHSDSLKSSFNIIHDRFVILIVDETLVKASGCSIDKSVNLMKEMGNTLGVNFFNRFNISYRKNNGEITSCSREDFEKRVASGEVTKKTLVFNNLITQLDELSNNWEIPFENSWHQQVFDIK